jgi:DNA polymerase
MIIGEAPGAEEDRLGKPFVGRAGRLLSQLLEDNNIPRDKVYITNCVKCRPPKNRDPTKAEMQACRKWLDHQINIIKPNLIILLGRIALKNILGKDKISDYNGKVTEENNQKYFITYHPSAGIRMVKWKLKLEQDFKKLGELYEMSKV